MKTLYLFSQIAESGSTKPDLLALHDSYTLKEIAQAPSLVKLDQLLSQLRPGDVLVEEYAEYARYYTRHAGHSKHLTYIYASGPPIGSIWVDRPVNQNRYEFVFLANEDQEDLPPMAVLKKDGEYIVMPLTVLFLRMRSININVHAEPKL
jgi:hypothetical protein